MSSAKDILRSMTPPLLWRFGQRVLRRSVDRIEYIPPERTPEFPPEPNPDFWSAFLVSERATCEALITRVRCGEPLLAPNGEELKYQVYVYALAVAGHGQNRLSVLDYGGNFGDYYWIGKAMLPHIELDFHCKELPAVADVGRSLTPQITWYTDERCFEQQYDVVMFSSCMQYSRFETLRAAARSARRYLLFSDVPMVRHVPAFFSRQQSRGVSTVQRHPNRDEIVALMAGAGLTLCREFDMGPHPTVIKAPEQPACAGLLFQRA